MNNERRSKWIKGKKLIKRRSFPHGQRGYFNIYILITCQFTHCMFRLGLCTRNEPGLACSMNSSIHSLHGRRLRSQPNSKGQSATIHTRVIATVGLQYPRGAAIPVAAPHHENLSTVHRNFVGNSVFKHRSHHRVVQTKKMHYYA